MKSVALAMLTYARMRIEMLKTPTFIKVAKEYLNRGFSIAIFVNFTESLKTIASELKTNCLIYGEQTLEQRNMNIDRFNCDDSRIIICNIRSGGVGISLHDKNGDYPRVAIVSPSWSAQDLLQALGRIHRSGGKTKVEQRIVFCKNTVEEQICETIKEKIMTIGSLNDGNEYTYNIQNMIEGENKEVCDEMTEFEKLHLRISVLHTKLERLKNEMNETQDEINLLEIQLNEFIQY